MNTIFILLALASIWEPPTLYLQSSHLEEMNPRVEYQRSIILPTSGITLILFPLSDQNTQGECPGGVVTSQGKNHANLISGRGRNLYPLEDVVILTKHDWAVVGEELLPNLDLELNLELLSVGYGYIIGLQCVLVNDSLHSCTETMYYVDRLTQTSLTVTMTECVDVTGCGKVCQVILGKVNCPKMVLFTLTDILNCDTKWKLPFYNCELLCFNQTVFNENYLWIKNNDIKLFSNWNLSNVWKVDSAPKRSHPPRSLQA